MIRLYTGRPGTGKTLKAVSDLVAAIEASEKETDVSKKRTFYADINGLKIDGVLPSPEDWRDTPEGSTIIYDEAQLRKQFAASRGASQHQSVRDLTIHRHGNRDVWFITQMPRLIHNDILDVVNEHIHLIRPYGATLASCYFWRKAEKNPDSRSSKDRAENEYIFNYRKDLYKFYHSAVDHTVKLSLPKKLIYIALGLVATIGMVYYFASSPETMKYAKPVLGMKEDAKPVNQTQLKTTDQVDVSNATLPGSPQDTTPQENLIQDPAQSSFEAADQQQQQQNRRIYLMEHNLPPDYEIRRNDPMLQVRGVAQMNGECLAYNAYGDVMTLSTEECKSYVNTGKVYRAALGTSGINPQSTQTGNQLQQAPQEQMPPLQNDKPVQTQNIEATSQS